MKMSEICLAHQFEFHRFAASVECPMKHAVLRLNFPVMTVLQYGVNVAMHFICNVS